MPPQAEPPSAKADPPGKGLPRRDGILIVVVIVVALTCATLLLFHGPTLLVPSEDYESQDLVSRRAYTDALNASRSPLGVLSAAILAGAAALIGVIVSNHNARLTRENNAIARANSELTRESLQVTRETLESTERRDEETRAHDRIKADDDQFAKAVEMLGRPAVAVRAGALHILYRLASSDLERTQPVVDVFCSYLRQPFHHPDLDHDPKWPNFLRFQSAPGGRKMRPSVMPETASTRCAAPLGGSSIRYYPGPGPGRRRLRGYTSHVAGNVLLGGAHIAGQVRVVDGTRIAQDVRVEARAHVTGRISVGTDWHWHSSPRSRGGAEMNSLWIENAHVGEVVITAKAKIHNVVIIDATSVEHLVWVKEGAVIGSNFILRNGTTVGGVWVDEATIGGGLSLEGHDLQIGGHVRINRQAEIGSLDIAARSIGGDVEVFAETTGTVSLIVKRIEGNVTIFVKSHKPGLLWMNQTTVKGTLYVADLSKPRQHAQMRAVAVHGGLQIGSLQLDKIEDVIWSGQGEKDLPANVQALPREGGDYTLQLLPSGQAETAAGS